MPIRHAIARTITAMTGDTRAPYRTLEKMSRPTWSVPNQCAADGALSTQNGWVAVPASPGKGAISVAKMATSTISSTRAPPVVSSGLAPRLARSILPRAIPACGGLTAGDSIIAA